jgi:hypothetical protein
MTALPLNSHPIDGLFYPPLSCVIGYSLLNISGVAASFTLLAAASGAMIGGLILACPTYLVLNEIGKTGLSYNQKQMAGILTITVSTCLSAVIGAAILGACLGLALNPFILCSVISASVGIALLMGIAAAIFIGVAICREAPKSTSNKDNSIPLITDEDNDDKNKNVITI